MKVKDLKQLVLEKPGSLTNEEFDNLEVVIFETEKEVYNSTEGVPLEWSGVTTFGGKVDENGEPIGEDWEDEKWNENVFVIAHTDIWNEDGTTKGQIFK